LDLDEAELLLGLFELVLDVAVYVKMAEPFLDLLPVGLDLGIEEGVFDPRPLLVVKA
jgi:hypothetical protein